MDNKVVLLAGNVLVVAAIMIVITSSFIGVMFDGSSDGVEGELTLEDWIFASLDGDPTYDRTDIATDGLYGLQITSDINGNTGVLYQLIDVETNTNYKINFDSNCEEESYIITLVMAGNIMEGFVRDHVYNWDLNTFEEVMGDPMNDSTAIFSSCDTNMSTFEIPDFNTGIYDEVLIGVIQNITNEPDANIQNDDFESWSDENTIEFWDAVAIDSGDYGYQRSDDSSDGNYSIRLWSDINGNNGGIGQEINNLTTLEYDVIVSAKTDDVNGASIGILIGDANFDNLTTIYCNNGGTGEWIDFNFETFDFDDCAISLFFNTEYDEANFSGIDMNGNETIYLSIIGPDTNDTNMYLDYIYLETMSETTPYTSINFDNFKLLDDENNNTEIIDNASFEEWGGEGSSSASQALFELAQFLILIAAIVGIVLLIFKFTN